VPIFCQIRIHLLIDSCIDSLISFSECVFVVESVSSGSTAVKMRHQTNITHSTNIPTFSSNIPTSNISTPYPNSDTNRPAVNTRHQNVTAHSANIPTSSMSTANPTSDANRIATSDTNRPADSTTAASTISSSVSSRFVVLFTSSSNLLRLISVHELITYITTHLVLLAD